MASCGSLQQIFENPLPENPTLIESLSPWNQIKSIKKPIEVSSFTEIFGELHFKENTELFSPLPPSSLSSPPSFNDINHSLPAENKRIKENENYSPLSSSGSGTSKHKHQYSGSSKSSDGYSPKSIESLQLCTEGLGVESFDGVDDESMNEKGDDDSENQEQKEKVNVMKPQPSYIPCQAFRRSRTSSRTFPPPISCIGRSGKPWVCFKSFRHDGRFILKEIKIPTQEFLHAFREDGRLKLQFVHSYQQILRDDDEGGDEEEDDGDDEDGENKGEDDDDDDSSKENNEKIDEPEAK